MRKTTILVAYIILMASAYARNSQFTRNGVAPLYWMGYEQPYITDTALFEERYEKNLQWFATQMLPYGYNMFCTDGWIEGAGSTVNQNGYITRYNSSWQHGFAYWMKRANDMGIELGVYYNPLWISSAVAGKDCSVKGRSDVKVASLRGNQDFNGSLWWCDPSKDGAEQYIKGYVRHFIDLGFKFLRCDFLCNFQNSYGDEKYTQALKWISEEAGDEIIVSLVMPNSHNKNKIENNYGDMFRICADCFTGGWDFISSRGRGHHNGGWPQFENLFDGFVFFSTISRTTTMMDGDFIRLNTCSRPEEKAFWISLLVMVGSPIAIADQYNTIGSDARYYQNPRLLELVREGFSGKPLSTDLNNKEQSSIWCGRRKAADTYVAAFFNREEQPVTYSLSLGSKLGFRSAADVVDLWTGDTLANQSIYLKFRLNPHECRMVQFARSTDTFPDPPAKTHLYGLGQAFGLWDSQYPWELQQTGDGIYTWEGDIRHYADNKQFKFCLNEAIWQKAYYLTPTEPVCIMEYGREYPMTLCSELTGDLRDYFWGVPEGDGGRYRITVDLPRQTVCLDRLVPQLHAVGSCFENDSHNGIALPRIDGTNTFSWEGVLHHPIDNKAFRFTFGTGDINTLQCLEPATSTSASVNISSGNTYSMRLCSKADGNMRNSYWNINLLQEGYKRLLIDTDALKMKVDGLQNLYIGRTKMQQGSSKFIYTAEAELHYTRDGLLPVVFYAQWEENGPLQPLRSGCLGLPSEADGLYQITFNSRTLQVTTTLLLDSDGLHPVEKTADGVIGSDDIHDLWGRKVIRPSRGIYIIGGRKVVI